MHHNHTVLFLLFICSVLVPFVAKTEEDLIQIFERSFNDKLNEDLQGLFDPASVTVTADLNNNELLWAGDKASVTSTFRFELLFASRHKGQSVAPEFSLLVDHTARGTLITSEGLFRDTRYASGAQFLIKDEPSVIVIPLSFGRTLIFMSFIPSFSSSPQTNDLARKSLICFSQAFLPKNQKNKILVDTEDLLPRVHSARILAKGNGFGEIGASITSGFVKVFFEPSKVLPTITPSEVISEGKSPRVKYSYQPGESSLLPLSVTNEELKANLISNVFLQSGAGNTRLLFRNHSARLASFLPSSLLMSKMHNKLEKQGAYECVGIIERVKSQIVYGTINSR